MNYYNPNSTFGLNEASSEASVFTGVSAFFGAILVFALLIGIVFYIFQSIGLYKMAKKLKLSSAWMAWVPLFNTYLLGKIASMYIKIDGRPSAKFGGWLVGLKLSGFFVAIVCIAAIVVKAVGFYMDSIAFVSGALGILIIAYLATIGLAIAYDVVLYIALWRIYAIFSSENATVFIVLSIIFSVTVPFFIFAASKNMPRFNSVPQYNFNTDYSNINE